MSRWRSKLLLTLIVYFAGFATAIYALAPAEGRSVTFSSETAEQQGPVLAGIQTDKIVHLVDAGMKKAFSFAEEKSLAACKLIKDKLAEQRQSSEE